jgi:DNA-binding CsgD family transcriptional regulator
MICERCKIAEEHMTKISTHAALTNAELNTVCLVMRGLSDIEMAKALGISYRTVKFYMGRVMRKLRVENRLELVNVLLLPSTHPLSCRQKEIVESKATNA